MNNKQAIAEFADTMLQHFPPFRQWEEYQEQAWANSLLTELSGFTSEEIKHAQREMVRSRKPNMPKPPMVSECIASCSEARRFLESTRNEGKLPAMASPAASFGWSSERVGLAYDLMKTPLGKEACREGWQLAMWEFCREHQRHPARNEIEQCRRTTREFDDTYRDLSAASERVGHMKNPLMELAKSFLEKREKIKAEVLGP